MKGVSKMTTAGKRTMMVGKVGDVMEVESGLSKERESIQLRGKAGTFNLCGSSAIIIDSKNNVYIMPATPSNVLLVEKIFERDSNIYVPLADGISMPVDEGLKKIWKDILETARKNNWQ